MNREDRQSIRMGRKIGKALSRGCLLSLLGIMFPIMLLGFVAALIFY